jgi:mRNA interferase RelE/StbE
VPDYKISISRTAQKQLDKIPDRIADPILKAILSLAQDPRPVGCKKLKGRDAYRIRKGDYRVIYEISDSVLTILIVAVGHRREIYE